MTAFKAPHLLLAATAALALAGCETVTEEATEALGQEFVAHLTPSGGGAARGKAEISLNDAGNMICTDLELTNGVAMTAGHIMGPGNTVVATLEVPDDNDSDDCDNVSDAVIDAIRANPAGYMVHIDATGGDLTGTLVKEG